MQGGRTLWERDEMRREGACEVEGKRDATWEAMPPLPLQRS
jgi:hypothetical protein